MRTTDEYAPVLITYPKDWESEYRTTGTVAHWHRDFPDMFPEGAVGTRSSPRDMLAQYALMYLLAKSEGVKSLTWFYLAHVDAALRKQIAARKPWRRAKPSPRSKNAKRHEQYWNTMREHMGDADFDALQEAVVRAGFKTFSGEPDLFCYSAQPKRWFFAEAKGEGDRMIPSERKWFDIARTTLGDRGVVRVYRVVSAKS